LPLARIILRCNNFHQIWSCEMELDPPFELTLPARRHWDRLAKEIYGQGRWPTVSQDMLATFCQTLVLAQECMQQILSDGVLVAGARTEREKVRHPLLTPLSQLQSMLVKLARSIPLSFAGADTDGAMLDGFIDSLVGSES